MRPCLRALGLLLTSACLLGSPGLAACAKNDAPTPDQDSKTDEKSGADAGDADEGIDGLGLDDREFPLLVWAAYIVSKDYYDPSRFDPKGQLEAAADALGLHTPEFFGSVEGDALEVRVANAEQSFSLAKVSDVREAGDVLEKVLSFTQAQLSLEEEPLHELEYAAINGFLAPLDPHTILLTPEEHADLGVKTRGHFGGIGAEIRAADRRILVARVLPMSPAERAGLLDGDLIVKIDDQSTVNMATSDAQHLLRGPVGSEVVVRVIREGEPVVVKITRDTIKIPSVDSALLPDRVGYVSIGTFQEDTSDKVEQALESLMAAVKKEGDESLAAVVFDLRANSGGLLTQATGILDQLVTGGELVIVHSAAGREHEDATKKLTLPETVPVVALIDENSASAAEIVSGSIKHLGRGVVIGQDSFGKGTVQRLSAARPYGRELALKLTVAEYRVAGDRKINSVGVRTDVSMVPVQFADIVGIARYYDDERFERARQRARTAHLPSARHEQDADAFVTDKALSLRYLDEAPEPPNAGDKPTKAEEKMRDPEVRIAQALAVELKGKGRKAQLTSLKGPVGALAKAQDAAIVEQAKEHQITWGAAPDKTATDQPLKVSARLATEGPVPAGEPFALKVAVTNEGHAVAQRVHLITDCAQDELDGIELLLGTIEAGQTVERTLELYFMPWHASLEDRLAIDAHVGDPGAEPDGRSEVMVQLEASIRPRFAFDWWLVDDPAMASQAPKRPEERFPSDDPFVIEGNGDGVLQPGERVLFAFEAVNEGPGKSEDLRAILRNLSGTQGLLEEGLVVVGELAAGKSARGAFGIDISKEADPALPFELDLLIGDGKVRESVNDKLRLRIVPRKEGVSFERAKATARVGEEPARLYAGAHATSGVVRQVAPGTHLTVVGKFGDWLAVRGKDLRRLWVPKDLVELGERGEAGVDGRNYRMIDPPRVTVADVPTRVKAKSVTVAGTATHPLQVRDVMIVVYPSDSTKPARKAHYAANPDFDPSRVVASASDDGNARDPAGSFQFSADVPIERGSNRISIVARDADKVERRHDVWVYRE